MIIQALGYSVKSTIKTSGRFKSKVSSLNIAEAGKERFYAKLRSNSFMPQENSDSVIFSAVPFADGNYTVICQTDTNSELLTIRSTGAIQGETTSVEIKARFGPEIPVRKFAQRVGGAITSRYKVDLTGGIHVDGNDYDSSFVPIGSGGVYGVWTCMTMLLQGDSALIGGRGIGLTNRVGLPLVRATIAVENAPVTDRLSSPEAFFGVAPGSLDKFIVPNLTTPFHGVRYVTSSVGPVQFGNSSGILIVHNVSKTAEFKGNGGTFKGLLICDNVNRINGEMKLLGAVVTLNENTSAWFGNGQANVLYSSQILNNLRDYCDNMKLVLEERSWKEIR
jgi:hypothetical protein